MNYLIFLLFILIEQEIKEARINDIHNLVYRLPKANFNMLVLLIKHLYR